MSILDTIPIQTLLGRSQTPEETDPSTAHPLHTLMASRFGFTCTPEDRSLYHQAARLYYPNGYEGLSPNRITAPWVREVLRIAAQCQIVGINPVEKLERLLNKDQDQEEIEAENLESAETTARYGERY